MVVSLKLDFQGILVYAWSRFGDCFSKLEKVTDITSFHKKCVIVTLKMCQGHLWSNLRYLLWRYNLNANLFILSQRWRKLEMSVCLHNFYISYKMLCNDLENGSRSLVLKINVGLVGIHYWYQIWWFHLKAEGSVIRLETDGKTDRQRAFL